MFGNTKLTATLGAVNAGATATMDSRAMTAMARAMADAGLPVLFIRPGTKEPLDLRSPKEVEADQAANPGANTGGVHLATMDKKRLDNYIKRAYKPLGSKVSKGYPTPLGETAALNLAVRLGGSGYVVADADTPEEVEALRAWLAPAYPGGQVPAPTVVTPGSADKAHHGGGHWWFSLPQGQVVDPELVSSVIRVQVPGHEATFSLYVGNAYVLVPPSVRPEGAYQLVSADTPAPLPLVTMLQEAMVSAQERVKARQEYQERATSGQLGTLEEQVQAWNSATPWEDILIPHGWVGPRGQDSCGCPIFTAPGPHDSPKSATAHLGTCAESKINPLNPPLHLWTDNPPQIMADWVKDRGQKTISKFNVYTLLVHDGDINAALAATGIERDPVGMAFGADQAAPAESNAGVSRSNAVANAGVDTSNVQDMHRVEAGVKMEADGSLWVPPRPPLDLSLDIRTPSGQDVFKAWRTQLPDTPEEMEELRKSLPPLGTLGQYWDRPAPRYMVEGLLEYQGLCSVVGAPGTGKTAIILDMAASMVCGIPWHGHETIQFPVIYVAGEGVAGATARLRAWCKAHDNYAPMDSFYIVEDPVKFSGERMAWAWLTWETLRTGAKLVIFDTLARMSAGLDENAAKDTNVAVTTLDNFRSTTGAGVLLVHHTTRGTTHGRGSSALLGAVDSELLISRTQVNGRAFPVDKAGTPVDTEGQPLPGTPITVQINKQKNGPEDVSTVVCLTSGHESIVVTDVDGNAATPLFAQGGGREIGIGEGETYEDTVDRVVEYVALYSSGVKFPTMSDIARGVAPDQARKDKAKAWRAHLDVAVDRALASRLLFKAPGGGYSVEEMD